mmetsp:Transcript_40022/g.128352  ORF Transcript_40022/g.128352 Transcript_40022/m.128352 type:complete len:717 (+) Transcript_40022:61-2211(+)
MQLSSAMPLLALVVLGAVAPAASTNPLGQVLSLMDSLAAKITKQGEAEAKAYHDFVEWCDDAAKNSKYELKTAQDKSAKLDATIGKAAGDVEASSAKIEELAGSVSADDGELKAATEVRDKEFKDFASSESELMESIDAVTRAIGVLQREMKKNPASFAQIDTSNTNNLVNSLSAVVDAASLASADKRKLMALVQSQQASSNDADDDDLGAPAAAAYKSHGNNIIDVLEDLKEKAEEELGSLRKAETNAKHNYEMLKQSLDDQMTADTKDMNDEKAAKAGSLELKATSEGDLANTVKDIADSQKGLETASSHCMQIAADHEATVASRKEELEVIGKAKAILSETSSGAVSQSYSFLQEISANNGRVAVASKLHTRADLANIEVVTLVKKLAKEHHSAALAQLASRISAVMRFGSSAGEDPFTKVKGMINDMISKLVSEAGSEASEKAYCDEQIFKTDTKKQELDYDLNKMTAKIDQAASASAGLKAEVQELQAELASGLKSQAEMDVIRREESSAFVQAKSDLEIGLEGVRKALGVLREYYGGAAAAAASAAMLQDDQPPVPEKHEKAGGAGTSILGILEVVESDFAKNLATEETEEDDAQSQYDTISQQNKITKTLKDQDVKYKTQEFKGLDKDVADLSGERETTSAELAAVLEYDSKIKARCIAQPESYEARKGRREAEVAGLKEALAILEDETSFVQDHKRGGRKHHFLGAYA